MSDNLNTATMLAGLSMRMNSNSNERRINDAVNVSETGEHLDFSYEKHKNRQKTDLIERNIKAGLDENAGMDDLEARFDSSSKVEHYLSEMKDMLQKANEAETKGQADIQMKRLLKSFESMNRSEYIKSEDDKKFLAKQFQSLARGIGDQKIVVKDGKAVLKNRTKEDREADPESIKNLQSIKSGKKGVGGILAEETGNLAGQYLNMQSIVSGMVGNNPLAMGLYGIAANTTKRVLENRREKKAALQNDEISERASELKTKLSDRQKEHDQANQDTIDEARRLAGNDSAENEETTVETRQADILESDQTAGDVVEAKQQERADDMEQDRIESDTNGFRSDLFTKLDTIISIMGGEKESANVGDENDGGFFSGISKFFGRLFQGLIKAIPTIVTTLFATVLPIASLLNGLWEGITEGWNKWVETGDLFEAIKTGANNLLSGMTFGLIDAETFQGWFDSIGGWMGKKVFEAVTWIKEGLGGLWDSITKEFDDFVDSAAEMIPGWDSKAEKFEKNTINKYINDGGFFGEDTIKEDSLNNMSPEERKVLIEKYGKDHHITRAIQARELNIESARKPMMKAEQLENDTVNNKVESSGNSKSTIVAPTTNVVNNNGGDSGQSKQMPMSTGRNPDMTASALAMGSMKYSMA